MKAWLKARRTADIEDNFYSLLLEAGCCVAVKDGCDGVGGPKARLHLVMYVTRYGYDPGGGHGGDADSMVDPRARRLEIPERDCRRYRAVRSA